MPDERKPPMSSIIRRAFGLDQQGRPLPDGRATTAEEDLLVRGLVAPNAERPTILIVSASPLDADLVRVDEEAEIIRGVLERSRYGRRFTLDQRPAAKAMDLGHYLLDATPTLAHFSGHGLPGGIALEDDQGRHAIVDNETLGQFFRHPDIASRLRTVIFNSCFSDSQATVVLNHVDAVIGTRAELDDRAAIAFSRGFYTALGSGLAVKGAYEFALAQMRLEGHHGDGLVEFRGRAGVDTGTIRPLVPDPDSAPRAHSGEITQAGDKHWRWDGELPVGIDDAASAVEQAIRRMETRSIKWVDRNTIKASMGGVLPFAAAATEELMVSLSASEGGGTALVASSRTTAGQVSDFGRNRANLETLVSLLGLTT